jgi:type I restriction enzyme, S subunit
MKTTRLDLPVMASWMESNGRRLDCNPYLSGGFEARVLLERLKAVKQPLKEVTQGGMKGIFNGPRFSRHYVNDPKHGVPFLGSTDILAADLSGLSMISKKQVKAHPELLIDEGWTLITCSGTIGRMVFSRADMKGMTGSQHFMRIVADRTKIPPGYLYAYLSSRFGVSLITSGTYGSIIQHLEPNHIADLPVPRLGEAIENEVHELITEAAQLRHDAIHKIQRAIQMCLESWGLSNDFKINKPLSPDTFIVNSSKLRSRFDGFFHSSPSQLSDAILEDISNNMPVYPLTELTEEIFETPRFGRIEVERIYGTPFLSITELGQLSPKAETYISRKQAEKVRAIVRAGWIILPRVGQLQGVFGRPTYIPPHLDNVAVSDNNIRLVSRNNLMSGYLFAALSTSIGYWQIIRQACGTSIPYIDPNRLKQVLIPLPKDEIWKVISNEVMTAMEKRSKAVLLEYQAANLIEQAVVGQS